MSVIHEMAKEIEAREVADKLAKDMQELDAAFDQFLINAYETAEALAHADAMAYGNK